MRTIAFSFLLSVALAMFTGTAHAQSDAFVFRTGDGAVGQPRLVITTSTGTAHAEVRVENAILRVSSAAPGTNVAAGDLRLDGTDLEYHDGISWRPLVPEPASSYVQIAPALAQGYPGADCLIHVNETGGGAPDLLRLEYGAASKLVVTNSGQLRLLGSDLFTDRWTGGASSTLIGVGVVGNGTLAALCITAVGYEAIFNQAAGGSWNAALGYRALWSQATGRYNTAMGYEAAYSGAAARDDAFGVRAGYKGNAVISNNVSFGYEALYENVASRENVILGAFAARNTTGQRNTAIGCEADRFQQTGGSNLAIGYQAGYGSGGLHSKSSCIFMGSRAGYSETLSNRLYIETTNSTTPLIYGEFDNAILRVNGLFEARKSSGTAAVFNRQTDDGTVVSLRQDGTEEGTISVAGGVVSYNPFTGTHLAWTSCPMERGTLVSMTGENRELQGRVEPVYGIAASMNANDPAVLGAYLAPGGEAGTHLVMAVGNGDLWVVDTGRDVRAGDLLISSAVPGCAMVDPGGFETAHVLGRAAENVRWSEVDPPDEGPRRKKIFVLFERFDLSESDEKRLAMLEEQVARKSEIIRDLKKRIEEIESENER